MLSACSKKINFISATLGFTWMALWVLIATSEPERHQRISRHEKGYILDAMELQLVDSQVRSQLICTDISAFTTFRSFQVHKANFPQGFPAIFKSPSCLAYLYASFVYYAGLTLWENFGLIYSKLILGFPIVDLYLWIVDLVPFLIYAVALLAYFYLKRHYGIVKLDSPESSGTSYLRWFTACGTLLLRKSSRAR